MKKYLFLVIALCYTVVTNAQGTDQSSAILQHGDKATFFKGSTAFQQAYAAAADGDVIILSEGTFEPVRIEKRLTIYGAGFEKNAETNTAITAFSGYVYVGNSNIVLDGFHMEGVKILGGVVFDGELKNSKILKCYTTTDIKFNKNIENVTVKQCRIGSVLGTNTVVASGLLVANCYLSSNVRTFSRESFINVDHCLLSRYSNEDYAQILFTNTIVTGGYSNYGSIVGQYSTIKNCIFNNDAFGYYGIPSNVTVGTYYGVNIATIFADAENADYTETRTFELKDPETYKGTDGTPIGPSGGAGWNKVPSKPSVANLKTSVSGTNLNVTYTPQVK